MVFSGKLGLFLTENENWNIFLIDDDFKNNSKKHIQISYQYNFVDDCFRYIETIYYFVYITVIPLIDFC